MPAADGSPESAVSETGTIAERAESLAKRWCACEAMMLQPSMEPERGEIEPELGVGAGDKLESHAGMLSMPRGKHGKAKVIGVNNQPPTKEALDRLEDRIFDREAQRLRRLRSFRATLNALQVDPTARTSRTAAGIEALGDAIGKLDAAIESAETVVARRDALRAAATTLADVPGVAATFQAELRLDPIVHKLAVTREIKRARATRDAYDAAVNGEFIFFIFVWAISMTSCFVHSRVDDANVSPRRRRRRHARDSRAATRARGAKGRGAG